MSSELFPRLKWNLIQRTLICQQQMKGVKENHKYTIPGTSCRTFMIATGKSGSGETTLQVSRKNIHGKYVE